MPRQMAYIESLTFVCVFVVVSRTLVEFGDFTLSVHKIHFYKIGERAKRMLLDKEREREKERNREKREWKEIFEFQLFN